VESQKEKTALFFRVRGEGIDRCDLSEKILGARGRRTGGKKRLERAWEVGVGGKWKQHVCHARVKGGGGGGGLRVQQRKALRNSTSEGLKS